jgi:hypothetical protein
MYLCQWHLDLAYGKQSQALEALQMWGKEKMASSEFRRARRRGCSWATWESLRLMLPTNTFSRPSRTSKRRSLE